MKIVDKESQQTTGQSCRINTDSQQPQDPGNHQDADTDDKGHGGSQSVDAVGQVDGIGNEENEDDDDVMCIHNKGIIPDVAYTLDYTYLQNIVDYTDSIYITKQEGEYLLKFLNDVYTDKNFPTQYTNAFRFEDAIQDFTDIINEKYQQDYQPFTADGKVTKDINDKLIKESYDAYLHHYDLLTESTL